MVRPAVFSFEYRVFNHYEDRSIKRIVESYAYMDDFDEFLYDIHSSNSGRPAYHDMVRFRNDLDWVYDSRSNIGEAFLDGGTLALDSIEIFSPGLFPGIHQELVRTRRMLDARWLGTDPTYADELAYVEELSRIGAPLKDFYMKDYRRLIASIHDVRGYKDPSQHDAIVQGFTLVMDAAARAYEADMQAFEAEAVEEMLEDEHFLISDITQALYHYGRRGQSHL